MRTYDRTASTRNAQAAPSRRDGSAPRGERALRAGVALHEEDDLLERHGVDEGRDGAPEEVKKRRGLPHDSLVQPLRVVVLCDVGMPLERQSNRPAVQSAAIQRADGKARTGLNGCRDRPSALATAGRLSACARGEYHRDSLRSIRVAAERRTCAARRK